MRTPDTQDKNTTNAIVNTLVTHQDPGITKGPQGTQ